MKNVLQPFTKWKEKFDSLWYHLNMIRERIPGFISRPIAEMAVSLVAMVDGKDKDQVRFELRAEALSNRYLRGDIQLREANEIADSINASGRFPGMDMKAEFDRSNLEIAARNNPPQV